MATKFAERAPVRRNLIPMLGRSPGFFKLVKSVDGDILIIPVTFAPGLKIPVKGESEK